ncbi:Pre-mRNA-splicing factor cwc26 [Coniosporium apollinis]|uniref:Pre-mRNA-splicing factor cwc26 n=1 Tax=Coniosporium apollinis TaxID=61459 RepID=A0ABQ9NNF6_9PEZI|nr:Pre-mRNA-splicing factor cwc26 [Coniosporium apollinis]
MSLADYLAKNYLTADAPSEKRSKKRKRKGTADPSAGLIIADDDTSGWNTSTNASGRDEDEGPTMAGHTASFRKSKQNAWKPIGVVAPTNADQAAADAIIASAAADRAAFAQAAEDAPVIENADDGDSVARMESGAHAGLQTASQIAAQVYRKKEAEKASLQNLDDDGGGGPPQSRETIYRDASGRIINVAMKRAEARAKADAEAKKAAEQAEEAKGDVQRREQAARRQQLQDAKYMPLARRADDVEMNEELRERDRWNDPAAQFISAKKEGRGPGGRQVYKGAAAPNRYGIRPGYRWDGVDRGNGFEKEWFGARNRRANLERLNYEWQMDE